MFLRPTSFFRGALALVLGLSLSACVGTTDYDRGDILAIGDSVLDWNGFAGQDIPAVVAAELGRPVVNASVSGARMSHPDRGASALGFDIRRQYRARRWAWVIMDGGANDLRQECGCGRCAASLDRLIVEDGSRGEYPSFVEELRASGAQVMLMGYYGPSVRGGPFAPCWDELQVLNARLEAFAASREGVHYVASAPAMPAEDLSFYDRDLIHPSSIGSAAIGKRIAAAMIAAGG